MPGYVDYEGKIKTYIRRIKEEDIPEENKKFILKFHQQNIADGLTLARQERLLGIMLLIAKELDKPFNRATKDDIVALVGGWEKRKDLMPWSRYTYRAITKKFFKWLRGETKETDGLIYPPEVRWIKNSIKDVARTIQNPNELLKETDAMKMIKVADSLRDAALIAVLFDSGARPKEVCSLRYGDVVITGTSTAIRIHEGKTGQRMAYLTLFPDVLARYMQTHKTKRPDDYLFLVESNYNRNKPLTYQSMRKVVLKTMKKAGITGKHRVIYLFRHSRITMLARQKIDPHALARQVGHKKIETTMNYIHLNEDFVKDEMEAAAGKPIKKVKVESEAQPRLCPRCKEINDALNDYCKRCGAIIDLVKAQQMQDLQTAAIAGAVRAEVALARKKEATLTKAQIAEAVKEELKKKKS